MSWGARLRAFYRGDGIGRVLMNEAIAATVELDGLALDVGGKGQPSYRSLLRQPDRGRVIVLDLVPDPTVDIVGSVTQLPLPAQACDVVLCFNVLEHVFDYTAALAELRRVLKDSGMLYGRVPFLIGIHGDPDDYWRYSPQTLARLLAAASFSDVKIEAQGGLFLVLGNLLWPLFRLGILRVAGGSMLLLLDRLFASAVGQTRNRDRYPLGYYFAAR